MSRIDFEDTIIDHMSHRDGNIKKTVINPPAYIQSFEEIALNILYLQQIGIMPR